MYNYQKEKPRLFTEEGQFMFLKIRDRAFKLIAEAGCVNMERATSGVCGDSWQQLACMDRLVELRELTEIKYGDCAGQHRIFVRNHH